MSMDHGADGGRLGASFVIIKKEGEEKALRILICL